MRRAALLFSPLLGLYVLAMLVLQAREGWTGDEAEYLNLAGNLGSGFYPGGRRTGRSTCASQGYDLAGPSRG